MAVKGLKISLLGDDHDLKAKLKDSILDTDKLKESLGHLKVKADDSEATFKLAKLNLSAEKLKERLGSARLTDIGFERAHIELLRLNAEADKLNRHLNIDVSVNKRKDFSLKSLFSGSALKNLMSGAEGAGSEGEAASGGLLDFLSSPVGIGAAGVAVSSIPALVGGGLGLGVGGAGMLAAFKEDKAAAKSLSDTMHSLFSGIGKDFAPALNMLASFAKSISPQLRQMFRAALPGIEAFMKALEPAIRQALPQLTQIIKQTTPLMASMGKDFGILLNAAVQALKGLSLAFKNSQVVVDAVVKGIALLIEALGYTIGAIANKIGGTLRSLEIEFWAVVHWVERTVSGIKASFSGLPAALFAIGENVINGLLGGLKAAAGGVLSFVGGLASKVAGIFSGILKIGSPSRVFHDFGLNIGQGLAMGIDSSNGLVGLSAARLAHGVPVAFGGAFRASAGRAGAPGGQLVRVVLEADNDDLMRALVKAMRYEVRANGGGNVQNYLGWQ